MRRSFPYGLLRLPLAGVEETRRLRGFSCFGTAGVAGALGDNSEPLGRAAREAQVFLSGGVCMRVGFFWAG